MEEGLFLNNHLPPKRIDPSKRCYFEQLVERIRAAAREVERPTGGFRATGLV